MFMPNFVDASTTGSGWCFVGIMPNFVDASTTGNGWCFVGMMPNFVDARHYWEWLVLCWSNVKLC